MLKILKKKGGNKKMYEDKILDEDFHVESTGDFFNGINENEEYFVREYMKPCENCGELRPKQDILKYYGLCYLCYKSETHKESRGTNPTANNNFQSIEELLNKWDNTN